MAKIDRINVDGALYELQDSESYVKPSSGIPKSDLSSGVQGSLDSADTAYQKPLSGIPKTDLDSNVQTSLGKGDTAVQPAALASYVNNGSYNSTSKKIELKHDSTVLAEIDATAFIKDGMVESVAIVNGNLVITFNTDAGKQPISIPLTDIFNPANYYTKTDVDFKLTLKQDVIQDLGDIRSGASAGATAYQKPNAGIPKTDLDSGVKSSLDNADGSVQQEDFNAYKQEANTGIAYDVSVLHPTSGVNGGSTYASLSAALAVIPQDRRKGGMSIKYVQSSDNKYVEFRYMLEYANTTAGNAAFVNTANWQGVDEHPVSESRNLIESGGVYDVTNRLNDGNNVQCINNLIINQYTGAIKSDGAVQTAPDYKYSNFIAVDPQHTYLFQAFTYNTSLNVAEYSSNSEDSFISGIAGNGTLYTAFYKPSSQTVAYVRLCTLKESHFALIDVTENVYALSKDILVRNLTKLIKSDNIADTRDIMVGYLVTNEGRIVQSSGWAVALVDLSQLSAGTSVTFGGFTLGRSGWYAFHKDFAFKNQAIISYSSFTDSQGQSGKTVTIPSGAQWLAFSIQSTSSPSNPYDNLMVNVGTSLKTKDTYKAMIQLINGNELYAPPTDETIIENDLTLIRVSNNIANPDNILKAYVKNDGTIVEDEDWRTIKIDLTGIQASSKIYFDGFTLARDYSWYAFYNGDIKVSYSSFYDPQGTANPRNVTVPQNVTTLYITIQTNSTGSNYGNVMFNVGESILPYEPYKEKISKIKGFDLIGNSQEVDEEIDELNDRVTAIESINIVEDLPVSADGSGLDVGDAYINSTTGIVTIKMS